MSPSPLARRNSKQILTNKNTKPWENNKKNVGHIKATTEKKTSPVGCRGEIREMRVVCLE